MQSPVIVARDDLDLEEYERADEETENIVNEYDTEDGKDDASAMSKMGSVKANYDPKDPGFFFINLEAAMTFIGIKAQYTKRMCILGMLPNDIKEQFKGTIKATQAPAVTGGYKTLKDSILETFGPKPGQNFAKATQLVNLVCKCAVPIDSC